MTKTRPLSYFFMQAPVALAAAAASLGIELPLRTGGNRGPARQARARQLAIAALHRAEPASFSAIGARFGRDRTTVRHACALVAGDGALGQARDLLTPALRNFSQALAQRCGELEARP